jgi:hypothetical protein
MILMALMWYSVWKAAVGGKTTMLPTKEIEKN